MMHLTPTRAGACAASLAVVAAAMAPAIAFYLTVVATAGLMGAAFHAYLRAVDRPQPGPLVDVAACALAGLLVVVDAALRFPNVLGTGGPPAATRLAEVALALTAAAVLAPAVAPACHTLLTASWRHQTQTAAARISDRSARLIRRIGDVT
jgi:hypothetical protein